MIDVKKGELGLRVQEEKVTFNVFNAIKNPCGDPRAWSDPVGGSGLKPGRSHQSNSFIKYISLI